MLKIVFGEVENEVYHPPLILTTSMKMSGSPILWQLQ